MQQNVRTECPKCSRPLQKFNGHIGYCSQHKWVSPSGLGFDAEAAEQNRQDAAAEEKRRQERARRQAQQQRSNNTSFGTGFHGGFSTGGGFRGGW